MKTLQAIFQWLFIFAAVGIALVSSVRGCAQSELYVTSCGTSYACTLQTGVTWDSSNHVWIFRPYQPNESIRIFVHNNNTSSAHAPTVTAWVSGSRSVTSFLAQKDRWSKAAVTDNTTANEQCAAQGANNAKASATSTGNGQGTCYTVGMFAAQIAVLLVGDGTKSGSPDTFDIDIVQSPSNYPGGPQPGNDSQAGAPNGAAVAIVDNVSDGESNSATQMIAATPGGLEVYPLAFNGTTWDRLSSSTVTGLLGTLSSTAPTDALANGSVALAGVARGGTAVAANANMGFNGTTWDRQRFGAAGYTTQTTTGVALTRPKELSTFGIGVGNSTPAATPTDIFEMCGNSSSTVQITRWEVGFTATAAPAANIVVLWIRRSSQDTGGTPNVFQPVASDASDTGALSTARTFGTNPTTGVLVGTLKAVNITPDNILSTSDPQNIYSYVQSPGAKPWTLRGAAQCIYLNLGGATLPAGFTFTSTIETIERTDI